MDQDVGGSSGTNKENAFDKQKSKKYGFAARRAESAEDSVC